MMIRYGNKRKFELNSPISYNYQLLAHILRPTVKASDLLTLQSDQIRSRILSSEQNKYFSRMHGALLLVTDTTIIL